MAVSRKGKGKAKAKAVKAKVAAPAKTLDEQVATLKSKMLKHTTGLTVQSRKKPLNRFVKWPKYIRIQRQRAVLKKRLKVPPAVHQFSQTLDANLGT